MSIDKIVAKRYRDKANQAVSRFGGKSMLPDHGLPKEGWLRTVRTALGMSGTQLAKKLGVTKARISKVEQDEPRGSVTLKTMQAMKGSGNARFFSLRHTGRRVSRFISVYIFVYIMRFKVSGR